MVDPRFFIRAGPFSLADVADAAGGVAPDVALTLHGIAPLQAAGPEDVSFFDNPRYMAALERTGAGAVIVHPDLRARVPASAAAIVAAEPYAAWVRVAERFHPVPPACPGAHASAVVSADARIDATVEVGPLAVIEAGAEIGTGCRIGPGAFIGAGVVVGRDCRIGAHASLTHAQLGARVHVLPGARIGQEGFGFKASTAGLVRVPHLGRVILEDDVEVGANATIDRGSLGDTVVGAGSRLDNLVHVAHNVRIGRCCVLAGQVGISGSTVFEDFVSVGGQAGFAEHLTVGRNARIGAQAGVLADVPPGAAVVGSPAQPRREFFRQVAVLKRLARRVLPG
jgi:UDP-3-O-[3-hydroxymyristoyl] glucosamine N-acyltransferase